MFRFALPALALAGVLSCCSGSAQADTIELANGRSLDGKVVKEDAQFVWVKTLAKIEKVAVADVKSRTPGESEVERWEKLRAAASKQPPMAADLWDLFVFQKKHAAEGLDKNEEFPNKSLLKRVLKLSPDHEGAHAEMGEARFEGQWVKQADIARLVLQREQEKKRLEWQTRLGVPVELVEADHFVLVDNTGDKDLVGRGRALDKAWQLLTDSMGVTDLWKGRATIITIKDYDAYVKVLTDFAGWSAMPANVVEAGKDRARGGVWRHIPEPFQIRWPSSGPESMWSAIVHNCSHVACWSLWRGPTLEIPPAWLEEGLAGWVETEVMGQQVAFCVGESAKHKDVPPGGTSDKPLKKKKDPKKNADDLSAAANEYKERCIAAIQNDEFPSMREYLRYKIGDFGPPEEGAALGMVTWLMKLDPEKFKKLIGLLRAGKRRTADEYWREAYDFQTIDDMETKFRSWAVGEW